MESLGVFRSCCICGKSFYCTDGNWLCSYHCDKAYQLKEIEEEHENRRQEDIKFCEESNEELCIYNEETSFDEMNDKELAQWVEFFEYMWEK